ncbi:MAG: glycosyltransferase family 4 protein [Gemmatimonadales bacterium]
MSERGQTREAPHLVWVNHYAVTPREGGGTRHFELARALEARGYRVTIVASDLTLHERRYSRRNGPADRRALDESIDGVRFRWLWAAPYERNDWRRIRNWISFGRRVAGLDFAADRPTLVIGSSPDLFAALGASWLARRLRVPFVLEVRDLWPESLTAGGARAGLGYRALGWLAGYLYRRASLVVTLTAGVERYLRDRGIGPVVCAPNGIDPAAFSPIRAAPSPRVRFVYLGAHGLLNGLDLVLEAAGRLAHRADIEIELIGDGPEKRGLMERARLQGLGNVRFRAPVPKEQVPAILAAADVGLMVLRDAPLFSFGVSPNKLFDYLGAGLTVVTNVPGEVADIVTEARAGEVAAPGSADALAAAMERMADLSPEERTRRGEAGRRWVTERHSREFVAGELDRALGAVAGGRA